MLERDKYIGEIIRIRQAQLQVNSMITEQAFKIPVHLALGHESIAVAVSAAMNIQDLILLNHRNIHYHLALGATVDQLIEEYKLSSDGLAQGKFGSMNLIAPMNRNIYTSNILGNNLAVALGVAQTGKNNNLNSVTWVVTGDGAIEEGIFYETLLSASSWDLPIVIIVENNKWSLGTEITQRRKEFDLAKLSKSLNCEYLELRGNNISTYVDALTLARKVAKQEAPIVVEVHLETLGGYFIEETSGNRYINYHAGKATLSAPNNEIIISENDSDPVFVNTIMREE